MLAAETSRAISRSATHRWKSSFCPRGCGSGTAASPRATRLLLANQRLQRRTCDAVRAFQQTSSRKSSMKTDARGVPLEHAAASSTSANPRKLMRDYRSRVLTMATRCPSRSTRIRLGGAEVRRSDPAQLARTVGTLAPLRVDRSYVAPLRVWARMIAGSRSRERDGRTRVSKWW